MFISLLLGMLLAGPAWSQSARSAPWSAAEIEDLGYALAEAWTHGLDPADYVDPQELRAMAPGRERDSAARRAWFEYAEDLAFGRVDPRALNQDWTATVRDQDLMSVYTRARETRTIYDSLGSLAPAHPDYAALRAELVRRVTLPAPAAPMATGDVLEPGMAGPRVDALRARLQQLDLLADAGQPGAVYDARLESALMRFQARRNLVADGRAGASTLAELNATDDRRLDQLRANLERWRWLAADLGARHIRVNIADYRLEAWRDGRVERVHDAQIGTRYASTPIFSEDMSIIEINPWWYTPGGLGSRWVETFRRNPAYAYSHGYHLVDLDNGRTVDAYSVDWTGRRFRVIQEPGPNNAMGEVKFLFPNVHNVYIHDTPHRELFGNAQRSESAGCVRVRDPEALAIWALEAEGWSPARVREAFAGERTMRVSLQHAIPVHILYFTAVTDSSNQVRFVHDIYARDQRLVAALDGARVARAPALGAARDENASPAP